MFVSKRRREPKTIKQNESEKAQILEICVIGIDST